MLRPRAKSEATNGGWKDTGSFIRKPTGGWLHPDWMLKSGVTFNVRYIGLVKILQSMRTIEDEDRGIIVREAISKCCDIGGFIQAKKKKIPKICSGMIGDSYNSYGGQGVQLNISKSAIVIKSQNSGERLFTHDITNISFASAGAKEYACYVAYVSKDKMFERGCFVLECPRPVVDEVICTMGQAFELKYKEFLQTPLTVTEVPERFSQPIFTPEEVPDTPSGAGYAILSNHPHGPDFYTPHYSVPRNSVGDEFSHQTQPTPVDSGYSQLQHGEQRQDVPTQPGYGRLNLPNCETEPQGTDMMFSAGDHYSNPDDGYRQYAAVYDNPLASPGAKPKDKQEVIYDNPTDVFESYYANTGPKNGVNSWTTFEDENTTPKEYQDPQGYLVPTGTSKRENQDDEDDDALDYQPVPSRDEYKKPNPLARESWFHGTIKREAAELLIRTDGDFLVRESSSSKGQFVLSGMHDGQCRHLLLVDPEGKVRTKDRQFKDVPELISFHLKNNVPIISGGSSVYLKKEVTRNSQDRSSMAI